MSVELTQPVALINTQFRPDLDEAAIARWLCDLDLHERFLTLSDYAERLQQMQLGLVPLDATLLP